MVAINAIHLNRIPEVDCDRLLWGERQIRSEANMTRAGARDFLTIAGQLAPKPKGTAFRLEGVNEALIAIANNAVDGAAVILS